MLDLNKLNKMLDSVLDSETPETLNNWIDEQIAADRAQGIIRDAEFGMLNMYDKYSSDSPLDKATIEMGMMEYVPYNKAVISDSYDSSSLDNIILAA
ncbi:MAG: hypothetical protein K2H60_00600 [Muribaculaceae bacterium]|nr:hypothetical protein [Muribaculaceae bacterium]